MQVPSTFKNLGFLSNEAERLRFHTKEGGSKAYAQARYEVHSAHSEISALGKFSVDSRLLTGLLYWLRALEGCQGAVVLADFGMQPTAVSALRTAYECLFASCAIWIAPETVDLLDAKGLADNRKHANAVLGQVAEKELLPELVSRLKEASQADVPNIKKAGAEELAKTAGMLRDYAVVYRTLSGLGAHPTEASLASFRRELTTKGGIGVGPDHTAAITIFEGAIRCIRLGRERLQRDFIPFVVRQPTGE